MLLEHYFNIQKETLYNKTENLQFVCRFHVIAFWNHHGQEKIGLFICANFPPKEKHHCGMFSSWCSGKPQ